MTEECTNHTDDLDTIRLGQVKARGFLATGAMIVQKESALGLYKGASRYILEINGFLVKQHHYVPGLGAVVSGIVPKMAIRFASFEQYKALLADKTTGKASSRAIFLGKCIQELINNKHG